MCWRQTNIHTIQFKAFYFAIILWKTGFNQPSENMENNYCKRTYKIWINKSCSKLTDKIRRQRRQAQREVWWHSRKLNLELPSVSVVFHGYLQTIENKSRKIHHPAISTTCGLFVSKSVTSSPCSRPIKVIGVFNLIFFFSNSVNLFWFHLCR